MGKQVLGSLGSSPVAKRFTQFCEFLESDQVEGSQDELFSNTPEPIFAMLSEEYCFRQPYFQKGKYIGKLNKILEVLKKLISNNTEKVRRELWQLRSIAQIIADCTHHFVQHSVRKEGLIVLQTLIECFAETIPEDLICLLVYAVDLSPYALNYPLPTPYFPATKSYMQIELSHIIFPAPARSEDTKKEESSELLRIVFSFLETVAIGRFPIWIDALKMTYFALLFPRPSIEMEVMEPGDFGFDMCPAELLKVVVQALAQWSRSSTFGQMLPALLDNLPIFMEISCQSFQLDPLYCETIEKLISMCKAWFIESNILTGIDEQKCWQDYMKNMSLFFTHGAKKDNMEELRPKIHDIAHRCFKAYFFFAVEFASAMTEPTWVLLQNTFMDVAVELSQRVSSEALYDSVFRVLFYIWVRSPYTTSAMWRDFYSKIGWLINRKSAIEMWASTLMQLTHLMKFIYYPSVGKDPNVMMDPFYTTIAWTKKSIVATWMAIFYTFEDFTDTQGAIYELFMKLLHEVSQILLLAEAADPDVEPPISVYNYILPILKDIVTRPCVPTPRVVVAYKTFCSIFVISLNVLTSNIAHILNNSSNVGASPRSRLRELNTKASNSQQSNNNNNQVSSSSTSVASKSISAYHSILCDFYEIILKGLDVGMNAIVCEILPSCVKVFSLQLPDVDRLIQPILTAIWNLTTEKGFIDGVPPSAKIAAMKVTSSLICFPREVVKRESMAKFLIQILNSTEEDEELLLWTIHSNCVFAFHELHESSPKKEDVGAIIAGILQYTASTRDTIAEAALDSLSTLALMYHVIDKLHIQCFLTVLKRLASNAEALIENGIKNRDMRESIICRHFSCLLDWIVVDGKLDVMKSDNSLCGSILNVAETAICCELFGHEEAIESIHEAADSFIEQLALLHNNIDMAFNEDGSIAEISVVPSPNDQPPAASLFYSFHDNVIWEFADEENGKIRLTIRKPTRKVSFKMSYDVSIAQIEEEWKKMGLEGDLDTERLFFSAKLERFLNKLYSTRRTFADIVGFQLSSQDMDTFPKTQKKRWSLLSVIRTNAPKKHPSQTDISPQSIVTKSCGVYDFAVLRDTKTERFARLLREIDRLLPSYSSKIGVIYVASGQILQGDILANERGSTAYESFVKGLGTTVDLTTHNGYNGGLDTIGYTSGKQAIFHSSPYEEIIFHVATMMPTVPGDRIQLNKKKHIGNDFVHIVWCDTATDYNRGTIGGQFNDAHIIVYPLANGLYRVAVHRKNVGDRAISFFGPVMDGMVLSGTILPVLLRQTAVFANRNCRKLSKGYTTPYHARNTLLKQTIDKTRIVARVDDSRLEVKTPPARKYDTVGGGKLRKSVSMENLHIVDKRKDMVRNSLRLRHSVETPNALNPKEFNAKTPRQLVSLFPPNPNANPGNAGMVGRSTSPPLQEGMKASKSGERDNKSFDITGKKGDNQIEGIPLPNNAGNINININININNSNAAVQPSSSSPPNVSVSFIVPETNNINLDNYVNPTVKRRSRRSHSTTDRTLELPKYPSSPDFRHQRDKQQTDNLSSPQSPSLTSSTSGTSIRSFLASLHKHVSSSDHETPRSKHKSHLNENPLGGSLVVLSDREKEKEREKERERERDKGDSKKSSERLTNSDNSVNPLSPQSTIERGSSARARSASAGVATPPLGWRRMTGGTIGVAGGSPISVAGGSGIGITGGSTIGIAGGSTIGITGGSTIGIVGGSGGVAGMPGMPGSPGMPGGDTGNKLNESGSAYFLRDLRSSSDSIPAESPDPSPTRPVPLKFTSTFKNLNSKSEGAYSPATSPSGSPPTSPPGTPPPLSLTAPFARSPPSTPSTTPPVTPPIPSSPGGKTPGLARRGTFNLIGKATDNYDSDSKKREKEIAKAKEKEKQKEKELEKRKEKERVKEEKEREKEEKHKEKEEKHKEKEDRLKEKEDKTKEKEREKARRERSSVKFEGELNDELPDEHLEYDLDDIVFKDGKERIKLKSKGGSLPSSLRKSKSFLRALAQKWTLSSKPPSYPPPHVPEGGEGTVTPPDQPESYASSDEETE